FLLISLSSFDLSAQEWVRFSDSILSNIQKNDLHQAESYMLRAEKELSEFQPTQDSLYAKYLFRKGVIDYLNKKDPEKEFLQSLNIWNNLNHKNDNQLF